MGVCIFFFQAEDGIRDRDVTGVQTCALPIYEPRRPNAVLLERQYPARRRSISDLASCPRRSEEHTSELQSHHDLVCRLLLEKKKTNYDSRDDFKLSRTLQDVHPPAQGSGAAR